MNNLNLGSKNISKKSAIQDHVNSGGHKEALRKEKARLSMVKATSNAVNHANKHVESFRTSCLDTGSIPVTST